MNLCKDCKYYVPDVIGMTSFAKCKHPRVAKINPVDGTLVPASIRIVRSNVFGGACMEEGILFVPAESKKPIENKQPWYKKCLKFIY